MSIGQLLEIGRRALRTHQAAMNTTGENISNAETEGYNRRQVNLQSTSTPTGGLTNRMLEGSATGTGVEIQQIRRVQDQLLSRAKLNAATGEATAEENHRLLRATEALFTETEDGSLNDQLSAFWNSWDELANFPTDQSARSNVRSRAQTLVSTFRRIGQGLNRLGEATRTDLQQTVGTVNDTLSRIADLNQQISTAEAAGAPDHAAVDKRDQLLNQLAEKVPITVQDRENEFTVQVQGVTAVQGQEATSLKIEDLDTDSPTVRFTDADVAFDAPEDREGQLGAQLKMLEETLPQIENDLNDLTNNLVTEVNNLHNDAKNPDGSYEADGTSPAGDFFDENRTEITNIQLDSAITSDVNAIAASGENGAAGDNTIALEIADLQTDTNFVDQQTSEQYASSLISDIGSRVQTADRMARAQKASAEHARALEEGVTGVSLNEEMTNLIKHQQAFAASARVVQTARELSDTLLSAY